MSLPGLELHAWHASAGLASRRLEGDIWHPRVKMDSNAIRAVALDALQVAGLGMARPMHSQPQARSKVVMAAQQGK